MQVELSDPKTKLNIDTDNRKNKYTSSIEKAGVKLPASTDKNTDTLTYVDLFCGAGGLSLGFERAGFKNIFSLDIDRHFCETYRRNFPSHRLVEKDIQTLTESDLIKLVGKTKIDVVIGGPPCQGFSIAGNIGRRFIDDPRNHLFNEFARVVKLIKPRYFVMENVARLYNHNNGRTREEILSLFKGMGYRVEVQVLNSVDYGVPQNRQRVIFVGSLKSKTILFPKKLDAPSTVRQAIDDLPKLQSGEKSQVPNHSAMSHTEQMLHKMSYVSDGGNRSEIPLHIRPKSGDIRKYIRYNSNLPSICITGDMRKVFHYNQNRALTVRELARLQSYPDDFIFEGPSISQQQQVGNSVPPLMAQAIASTIRNMAFDDFNKSPTDNKNKFPKVNFIGNKEKIAYQICNYFPENANSIVDAFSGGGSVSYEAKKRGLQVISNDIMSVNYLIGKSLIENEGETLDDSDVNLIFAGTPFKGFMYENYSNVYFFPEECMQLDLYRRNIESLKSEYKRAMALVLLRRAMIRKMPYSRFNLSWEKIKQLRDEEYSYAKYKRRRAYHNQSFKAHFLANLKEYNNAVFKNGHRNIVYNKDVFELLKTVKADIVYLDPPYTGTMNNYFGFYGLIDSFIMSKKVEPFNNNFVDKNASLLLFKKLFSNLADFKYWYLSYNNSSYPTKEQLLSLLREYSDDVRLIELDHKYKVTGKQNKDKNKEYLFIVKNKLLT